SPDGDPPAVRSPLWDPALRELRWEGLLVKRFRLPAPNQEAILAAFEEDGWPARIDDPLPRDGRCDPHDRLHETLKGLNRNQRHRLIQFGGDGTGMGAIWTPLAAALGERPLAPVIAPRTGMGRCRSITRNTSAG